jgi:Domain of unknown function (DUF4396)
VSDRVHPSDQLPAPGLTRTAIATTLIRPCGAQAIGGGLGDPLFWWSLVASLAVAFVIAVPVNRMMIARGKGRAVVHQHHHH